MLLVDARTTVGVIQCNPSLGARASFVRLRNLSSRNAFSSLCRPAQPKNDRINLMLMYACITTLATLGIDYLHELPCRYTRRPSGKGFQGP